MRSIEVRNLEPADHAGWLPLWQAYQAFYEVDIAPVTETTWARLLNMHEPMFGAVGMDGPAPVGLVHWVFHRSTWSRGDVCYLQDLYVAPEQRRAGIGEKLIAHVHAAAGAAGCAEVYWLTHERNVAAMRLYDRVAVRSAFVQYQMLF